MKSRCRGFGYDRLREAADWPLAGCEVQPIWSSDARGSSGREVRRALPVSSACTGHSN
jgi:hypothetical protein